ncbi:NUDIX hydrolase [Sciscionella sediminilitoris]|uniref:NUDIX hydrolase n=1 Tax=Sciscionella sediminilitoris TaxID=1445613 RepID=UPI0004DF0181|nr:CoA pyrophosphatase [Sciscionella sp. SE31]
MIGAELRDRLRSFEPARIEDGDRRRAAVTLALHSEADGQPRVWLTLRSAGLRQHASQFAFPGGRLDPGEDAFTAARRELHEELGVALGRESYLARLDDYATRSGYVITPFVVDAGQNPVTAPNPGEVAELFAPTLPELDVTPRFLRIPESERPVIQLPLLGTLIHAPTAAILYQFRELALHGRRIAVADYEQPVFAWK